MGPQVPPLLKLQNQNHILRILKLLVLKEKRKLLPQQNPKSLMQLATVIEIPALLRIKVEKEVRQIIADEEESEKEALFIDSNTSEHDQLAAWLEQTVQDKSEAKKKEEQSLHKRQNEQEMLKQEKEDLWKKEKMRRSSALKGKHPKQKREKKCHNWSLL